MILRPRTDTYKGLTTIIGAAAVDSHLKGPVTSVITNTYYRAPEWNAEMMKVMGTESEPFLMQTYYGDQWPYIPPFYAQEFGTPDRQTFTNFLNE